MTGLGIASYPFISNMVAQRHASQVVKDYETNVEEMDEEKIDVNLPIYHGTSQDVLS